MLYRKTNSGHTALKALPALAKEMTFFVIPYRIDIVPEVNGTGFSNSQKPPEGHNDEGRNKAEMEQPVFPPTSRITQASK